MKRIASLLTLALASLSALADAPTDWYSVHTVNRPFVRWWWHGSAVDSVGLNYNLEEFAKKGLGGVEITPIYGVQDNEAHDIPFLSPRWMDMLGYTIAEADRLGLQVDMNNGTGWPFGGPEVTTDDSARKMIIEKWQLSKGQRIDAPLTVSDEQQRPIATLQAVMATDGTQRILLTDKVRDGRLDWKAPKGEWTVYALFQGRTFQKVKRAAPGGEGYVVNHYDSIAVKKYLARFDKAFAESGTKIPANFFNDSYEVYGSDWTDNLFDAFEADHGYDLRLYIPELANADDRSDTRSRVVRDYRETLGNLLYDNFTRVWTAWAHSHGALIRNQSHGSPANILDLYAVVDIPECETFGQTKFDIPGLVQDGPSRPSDADPAVLKFASSAAHIAGKPLTSAETLTWLTEHFRTSLARCKPEIDQMFASGVNHVYFHGATYSPKGVEFPGWLFYASINMSPTNSIWTDANGLFDYIARCQAFLTAGKPDNDFLLYFPQEDIWADNGGAPYLMFDIHKMDQRMPSVKRAVGEIMKAGYDVDYVSDKLLGDLTVDNHLILSSGGAEYKAIIVPPVHLMSVETLQRLIDLAAEGATIVFVDRLPSDVPGLANLDARRDELAELLAQLPKFDRPGIRRYGRGNIAYGPTFAQALDELGIVPEQLRREGLSMIRRRNEVGGYNYFIADLENRTIDSWVHLAANPRFVEIFDPVSGRSGLAQVKQQADSTLVRLQLQPGQSILLKTFAEQPSAPAWRYVESRLDPVVLNSGWSISFPQSEPPIEGTFATDTVAPWTSLPVPDAKVNFGTGRYSATFTLDDPTIADDWILSLGTVRESARVRINGHDAGTAWSVPFELMVGQFLRKGQNTIEIDVTNLQANRIADYERRGIKWRKFKDTNINSVTGARQFNFGDWPTVPAGLTSPLSLIPVKLSE